MRRTQTTMPIAIVRQGGRQTIIGEVVVGVDGNIVGHLERQAVDNAVQESLGNVSFALYLPRKLLRLFYRRKGRHQRESLTTGGL